MASKVVIFCFLICLDRIVIGLLKFGETGEVTTQLQNDLHQLQSTQIQTRAGTPTLLELIIDVTICTICNIVARIIVTYRQIGGSKIVIKNMFQLLCYQFETQRVCDGILDLNLDILLFIFDNKKDLNVEKVCSIIGQSHECYPQQDDAWSVYLPPRHDYNTTMFQSNLNRTLRILHITDIHYDWKYKVGSNAQCNEPICCGYDQGKPITLTEATGAWGDYGKCDMPYHAVKNLMEEAAKHNIDFIYHTGDIVSHRVWETSKKTNRRSILEIHNVFKSVFPNKTIYPIIGNHEPSPVNVFAPQNITGKHMSSQWLYDLLAREWMAWLPKDTKNTIQKGGYYTVLVRPGLRIIALNSNVAYIFNWWLLYDTEYIHEQLKWLVDTLYQAEMNNEFIHILSHIPSGDIDCYRKWSIEYNKIVKRFAHMITAQFVGHTHYNEINLYYDKQSNKPINVAFNGGSFTTYTDVNPLFRIYELNPTNYRIENYEDWIYNVTEANKFNITTPPIWYKLYSFKEAYDLTSMELPELDKFAQSLANNETMLNIYFRLKVRDADSSLQQGCDEKCKNEQLCRIVTTQVGDEEICNKLKLKFQQRKQNF